MSLKVLGALEHRQGHGHDCLQDGRGGALVDLEFAQPVPTLTLSSSAGGCWRCNLCPGQTINGQPIQASTVTTRTRLWKKFNLSTLCSTFAG